MPRKIFLNPLVSTFLLTILLISGCKPSLIAENPVPDVVLTTYETSSFVIQIPENYIGAEPNSPGVNAIVSWMTNNGYDAQGFVNFVQANATDILFTAIDTELSLSGSLSYLTLAGGERPEGFSVDEYMNNYSKIAPEEIFLGREQKDLGEKSVDVLLYEFSNGGTTFRNSFYFIEIEEDNQLWKFEFVSPKTEYDEKIEDFEKIVAEFKPKPGE